MKAGHSLGWRQKLAVQHFTLVVQNRFNNPTIFPLICRWLLVMVDEKALWFVSSKYRAFAALRKPVSFQGILASVVVPGASNVDQVFIPVGWVRPASVTISRGVGGIDEVWYRAEWVWYSTRFMLEYTLSVLPRFLQGYTVVNSCKSITFPQLRLRVVIKHQSPQSWRTFFFQKRMSLI